MPSVKEFKDLAAELFSEDGSVDDKQCEVDNEGKPKEAVENNDGELGEEMMEMYDFMYDAYCEVYRRVGLRPLSLEEVKAGKTQLLDERIFEIIEWEYLMEHDKSFERILDELNEKRKGKFPKNPTNN